MKILPIKKKITFFPIQMLLSCYHYGYKKVIDKKPKKAILGEDYTIEKYRSKCTSGQITFQIVDDAGKTPDVPFYIEYNGMFFFDKPIVTFRVFSDRKYNFNIGSHTSQTMKILNIKPQSGDSLVIKAEIVDEGILARKKIRFK